MAFIDFMAAIETGNSKGWAAIAALPSPIAQHQWLNQVERISPHLYGKMPKAITEAFPNESETQKKYRHRVHESSTKGILEKAINELQRIVMGEQMTVQISEDLMQRLKEPYSMGYKFSFERWALDSAYIYRVKDPNALLAVIPTNVAMDAMQTNMPLGARFEFIASKDVLYYSSELVVTKHPMLSAKYQTEACRVFTKGYYLELMQGENSTAIPVVEYTHNIGQLLVQQLGGVIKSSDTVSKDKDKHGVNNWGNQNAYKKSVEYTYYESDFAYAVPTMNRLEVLESQLAVATNTNVFPTKVSMGLDCEACRGKGRIHKKDPQSGEPVYDTHEDGRKSPVLETCSSCKGKGTINLGVMDQISVPMTSEPIDMSKVLQYIAPDLGTIQELGKQIEYRKSELNNELNVFAPADNQSGVSKEMDRQTRETALKRIADGFTKVLDTALNLAIDIVFSPKFEPNRNAKAKDETYIKSPSSFSIQPASEIKKKFMDSLASGNQSLRKPEYLDYLRKEYGEDAKDYICQEIAIDYTFGGYLYTQNEVATYLALGIITLDDAKVYRAIGTLIDEVYRELKGDFVNREKVFNLLDAKVKDYLAKNKAQPPQLPSV